MHSRKSQSARTKVANQFRSGVRLIMFSSDVSARGLDYDDVSCVLQIGVPADRDQYIHRIGKRVYKEKVKEFALVNTSLCGVYFFFNCACVGRTARAGKVGQGTLLLADFESNFLRKLQDLV